MRKPYPVAENCNRWYLHGYQGKRVTGVEQLYPPPPNRKRKNKNRRSFFITLTFFVPQTADENSANIQKALQKVKSRRKCEIKSGVLYTAAHCQHAFPLPTKVGAPSHCRLKPALPPSALLVYWECTLPCASTGSASFRVYFLPTEVGAPSRVSRFTEKRTLSGMYLLGTHASGCILCRRKSALPAIAGWSRHSHRRHSQQRLYASTFGNSEMAFWISSSGYSKSSSSPRRNFSYPSRSK